MANFDFLKEYKLEIDDITSNRDEMKHIFFPLIEKDISYLEKQIKTVIPNELTELYMEIGYGFIHNGYKSDFNRLLPPDIIAIIMNREDQYEFDPDLDIYDDPNQLIFYEVNEGIYLTVELNKTGSKSPVYYFDDQISDSIETFLKGIDENPEYLEQFEDD